MSIRQTPPIPDHQPGTPKGEERLMREGKEPGRIDEGTTRGADRPAGKPTPRLASGIVTKGTIDPNSPYLPPA